MRTPGVVTATFGGNDLGFAPILADCFLHNCVRDGRLAKARQDLPALQSRLADAFARIRKNAHGARVLIVGYPNIFNAHPSNAHLHCLWLVGREDRQLVRLASALDAVEHAAATTAGVSYVSQLSTFRGHELCTAKSWVESLAPKFSNSSGRGHPSLRGQQAMAAVVRSDLRTLGIG